MSQGRLTPSLVASKGDKLFLTLLSRESVSTGHLQEKGQEANGYAGLGIRVGGSPSRERNRSGVL